MFDTIEQYCSKHKIQGQLLAQLYSLDPSSKESLLGVLSSLRPSANTLRNILKLSGEIAKRDKKEFSDLFSKKEIQDILNSELGRKHKQEKITEELKLIRFPEMAKIKNEIASSINELRKEYGLRLNLPENLEGDKLRVQIEAKNADELLEKAKNLCSLSKDENLEKIFSTLKGDY